MTATFVLDTSALLATLYEEPGKDRVEHVLLNEHCLLAAANLAELAAKCAEAGMTRSEIDLLIQGLDIEIVDMDAAQALDNGLLRPPTRSFGLSLGDRACLALAIRKQATALTADRVWIDLDLGLPIECIRNNEH